MATIKITKRINYVKKLITNSNKIAKQLLTILILSLITSNNVMGASFNCSYDKLTSIEKIICSDENLSNLDDKLQKKYKNLINITPKNDVKKLKNNQVEWIKLRNKCDTNNCLDDSYNNRLNQLDNEEKTITKNKESTEIENKEDYSNNNTNKATNFPEKTKIVNDENEQEKFESNNNVNIQKNNEKIKNNVKKEDNAKFKLILFVIIIGVPFSYATNKWNRWKRGFNAGVASNSEFRNAIKWWVITILIAISLGFVFINYL